jgi:hypothetical protein
MYRSNNRQTATLSYKSNGEDTPRQLLCKSILGILVDILEEKNKHFINYISQKDTAVRLISESL